MDFIVHFNAILGDLLFKNGDQEKAMENYTAALM